MSSFFIPRPAPIDYPGFVHARFSPELKEGALAWIQKLSRYIVAEEVGGATSKTHYHAAFKSDVGLEAIKKRFQTQCKALGLVSKKGQENAYYGGVKECTDISYICKEGKYIASGGFSDEELQDFHSVGQRRYPTPTDTTGLGVVALMNDPPCGPVKYATPVKTSMKEKFKHYLLYDVKLEKNCINPNNWTEMEEKLSDYLTEMWENAFTTPQGAVCIEYAKWIFADAAYRVILKKNNLAAIRRCLR